MDIRPQIVDVREQLLRRLYNQCKQLKLKFPYDFEASLNDLDSLDTKLLDDQINSNLKGAKRRLKTLSLNKRFQNIYKQIVQSNKRKNKKSKRKKGNKKWAKIISVPMYS
jgi:hypothetical protein